MMINNYNNISFGQKVPTLALLRMGTGVYDYEDAKNLCLLFDNRFPGHVGYFKKATKFAKAIAEKNENVSKMFDAINSVESKNDKLLLIRKFVMTAGKEIDVTV